MNAPAVPGSRHIAVVNRSAYADHVLAAFAVEAARTQLQEHLPAAFPGSAVWTIGLYADAADIGAELFHIPILLLDDDGDPGSLAWHSAAGGLLGGAVTCKGQPDWPSALMHEIVELAMDPYLTRWVTMPDGRQVAYEVADPVQDDEYPISATIEGRTRTVMASNFVTAAWFRADAEAVPFDHMRSLGAPFELGRGYRIVKDTEGVTGTEFGYAMRNLSARKFQAGSRTARRLSGR